jgi:hypothetical protein
MQHPIFLFITGLLKRWFALLSCAAFTVVSVYTAAENFGNGWVVGSSAILAIIFFVVAAYQTWNDEHEKYTTEVAKNQRPGIRGEVSVCGYGTEGEGQEHGYWSSDFEVVFQLSLCNYRPVNTTLQGMECDGSQLMPPVVFDSWLVHSSGAFPVGTEMPQGIGKTIDVAVQARIAGVRLHDVHPTDLQPLKCYVVDAFS